jgi:hypothetical protein
MPKPNLFELMAFSTAFANYKKLFNIELDEWKEAQLKVLRETDCKTFTRGEIDYTDFGIQSFCHFMQKKHDEYVQMLAAIRDTRDLADGRDI